MKSEGRWIYFDDYVAGKDTFPGYTSPIITPDWERGPVRRAKWGLTHPREKPTPTQARSETINQYPIFRDAFRSRRCVVPASAFYEQHESRWWRFEHPDGEPLLFAGIFEEPNAKTEELTYAVATTRPNAIVEPFQDRMPVVFDLDQAMEWLDPSADLQDLQRLMTPYPDEWLVAVDAGSNKRKGEPSLFEE